MRFNFTKPLLKRTDEWSSQDRRQTRVRPEPPSIVMSKHVMCAIMCSVGAQPAETGGILLGPVGSSRITDFYFDTGAACSRVTYTPDHITLSKKLKQEWIPAGIDFKGFVHSHPGTMDCLSGGDMEYIGRLLAKNQDIKAFPAPIVIPHEYRLRAIVVMSDRPNVQCPTTLRLF